jgi:hypothetical protein
VAALRSRAAGAEAAVSDAADPDAPAPDAVSARNAQSEDPDVQPPRWTRRRGAWLPPPAPKAKAASM